MSNVKDRKVEPADIETAFEFYVNQFPHSILSMIKWNRFVSLVPGVTITLGNVERSTVNELYGFPILIDGKEIQWWPLLMFLAGPGSRPQLDDSMAYHTLQALGREEEAQKLFHKKAFTPDVDKRKKHNEAP